jgi:hypothetical protein
MAISTVYRGSRSRVGQLLKPGRVLSSFDDITRTVSAIGEAMVNGHVFTAIDAMSVSSADGREFAVRAVRAQEARYHILVPDLDSDEGVMAFMLTAQVSPDRTVWIILDAQYQRPRDLKMDEAPKLVM